MNSKIIFNEIFPNDKVEGLKGIALGETKGEVRKTLGSPTFERTTQLTFSNKIMDSKDRLKVHVIFHEEKVVQRIALHYFFNKKDYEDDSVFFEFVDLFISSMNEKYGDAIEEKERGEKHPFRYWYDKKGEREMKYFSSIYEKGDQYTNPQHVLKIGLNYK